MSRAETETWLALIGATIWLPAAMDVQLERDAGISSVEYAVLSALIRQPDRSMRIKNLALAVNSTLPRMSKVLNRLQHEGWLERHPDPSDGRATFAVLTEEGRHKVAAATPGHVALVRRIVFDQLTPEEITQLSAAATKIAAAAGPDGASASRWG